MTHHNCLDWLESQYLAAAGLPATAAAIARRDAPPLPPKEASASRRALSRTFTGGPDFADRVFVAGPSGRYELPHRGGRSVSFSWGYAGGGCVDLAYSILFEVLGHAPDPLLVLEFVQQRIRDLPERRKWALSEVAVASWLVYHEVDA